MLKGDIVKYNSLLCYQNWLDWVWVSRL